MLYDISMLGEGIDGGLYRTGVFRVVDNVASWLAADPGVDLTFCAKSAWHVACHAREYLRGNSALRNVPLSAPELERPLVGPAAALAAMLYRKRNLGLPTRIARGSLRRALVALHRCYPVLSANELQGYQVFHSPYYPLPPRPHGGGGPVYFLTIYDLIPVLYPSFASGGFRRLFSRILGSLGSDGYALCISHAVKDDLCGHLGIEPSRVFVTPLAASRDVFHPVRSSLEMARVRERYGIPPEAQYVLSLNALNPRKNIDHAVRSFARLVQQERIADLYLVLAGPKGWDFRAIFETIATAGVARERVIVAGYVPDEDLAALYSGALFFVYPSLYEGFGLPVLEAMQCGVPVITSDTSSLPEVVADAGVLIDPTDPDELCQAMLELYRDPERRRELSAKALARARTFSWERCAEETVDAYKTALASA